MKELIENFEALEALMAEAKIDFVKFTEKGNKAAGTRVRKMMLEAKKLEQAIRVGVQEIKNAEK